MDQPDFRKLFEAAPASCLVLDPRFVIVAVTDGYLEVTMTRREEILGRGLFEVFPDDPDDPAADGEDNLRASLDRVLEKGVPDAMAVQKYAIRRPAEQGGGFATRYWNPVNAPVKGPGGEVLWIVHRAEDVTDFVRLKRENWEQEAEILASNRRLEEANKDLNAFAYSVSHDLRAPLRAITGFTKMVIEESGSALDETARRQLDVVRSGAARMSQLIEDLLGYARFARLELRSGDVDMSSLAREVVEEAGRQAAPRSVRFHIGELPPCRGDRVLLRQVLLNLVGNAVKYTARTSGAEVRIEARPGANAETIYSVSDNGAGFDPDYAHKLFRVFQRLHTPEEFEGSGVGLAIVQRMIRRHGGRVWAEGACGKGATFFFALRSGT